MSCHQKIHGHGVGSSEGIAIKRKEGEERTYAKRKSPATFTIEGKLLRKLDGYIKRRTTILGGSRSKSSIVEEALAEHLFKLERELTVLEGKDISVIR